MTPSFMNTILSTVFHMLLRFNFNSALLLLNFLLFFAFKLIFTQRFRCVPSFITDLAFIVSDDEFSVIF